MRTDFRREFKGWDKNRITSYLPYLKDKLLLNIGVCDSNVNFFLKRISYLENKIKVTK